MMRVCPVCGKYQVIHWPEHWVYRRRDCYLCSENCLMIFDTREYKERVGWIEDYNRRKKKMPKKITLEQKKRAVKIALEGGDPKPYLKECGSANPDNLWWYIRKTLKEKDPGTFEQLPDRIEAKKQEEQEMELHMAEPPKPIVDLTIESEELTKMEVESEKLREAAMRTVEKIAGNLERKPLNYDGFDVLTIKNEFGMFHYDAKFNLLDWTSPDGEEVSFTPDCWKAFATEILPKAMAILGAVAKN